MRYSALVLKGSAKSDNIHNIYIDVVLHSGLYRNVHLLLVVLNILDIVVAYCVYDDVFANIVPPQTMILYIVAGQWMLL